MRYKASKLLKRMLVEIAWLLGSWAISFGLLGWLIGFNQLWVKQLDIQMHNTYFVFGNFHVTVLLFLLVALVVTSARAIAAPLRTRYTWVVLLLLGTPFLLGILLVISIKKS